MGMQLNNTDSCNGKYGNSTMIFLHLTFYIEKSRDEKWSGVVKRY